MIYAIKAGEHIKFGSTSDPSRRLAQMDTNCPHELEVLALADWPHTQESAIQRIRLARK